MSAKKLGYLMIGFVALGASASASAQFFFLFPIPRGPSDPDKIEATPVQRQYAMCAAYNANVLDPNLSGNRSTSWRGEVIKSAKNSMSDYASFDDLMNRYIRQWRLQIKSSYEAGMAYSKTLVNGCLSVGLPYSFEQVASWRSSPVPSSMTANKLTDRDPFPVAPLSIVENIHFSERPISDKSILIETEITKEGRVKSCRSFVEGANRSLETQSCQILARQQFSPKIEGSFPTFGFYQIYVSPYSQSSATTGQQIRVEGANRRSEDQTQISGDDPVLRKAMIRCNAIGHKQGTPQFGSCVERQIGQLEQSVR